MVFMGQITDPEKVDKVLAVAMLLAKKVKEQKKILRTKKHCSAAKHTKLKV